MPDKEWEGVTDSADTLDFTTNPKFYTQEWLIDISDNLDHPVYQSAHLTLNIGTRRFDHSEIEWGFDCDEQTSDDEIYGVIESVKKFSNKFQIAVMVFEKMAEQAIANRKLTLENPEEEVSNGDN